MTQPAAPEAIPEPAFAPLDEIPGHPGWRRWSLTDPTRFNTLIGPMMLRVDGEGASAVARVRMTPEHRHSNLRNNVHGGALLAFIDVALFAAARGLGLIRAGTAVTLDLSTQFIGGGRIGEPIEAQVELLKETGRLLFLRGLVVQGDPDERIVAFSGTIRKPGGKPGSGAA